MYACLGNVIPVNRYAENILSTPTLTSKNHPNLSRLHIRVLKLVFNIENFQTNDLLIGVVVNTTFI